MIPEKNEHQLLNELLTENQKLLTENNELLRKLNKRALWGIWLKIVWVLVLVGAPVAIYYYLIEPYFNSVGVTVEAFQQGLSDVPGWDQFYRAVTGQTARGE
jgi:hypothetical protein